MVKPGLLYQNPTNFDQTQIVPPIQKSIEISTGHRLDQRPPIQSISGVIHDRDFCHFISSGVVLL